MTTGTPEPGAQLGAFRLGRRLGVGGMGIVFQALDTQLNRQVALKVITPHIGDDEEFRARFTREAQAQASLDSPHVVQVYSFGEADGRLYIASQLIPDGDLGQMLTRHGRPPARIALNLIAQVADGLSDAHAAGLIHRDIKPANVLLRNRDNVLQAYLGDFGIARQMDAQNQLTQAGHAIGTPTYMAPELHMGAESGPASDIYSMGCLLWAALSGQAPYSGSTDYQIVMAHLEGPIPQLAPTGPLASEINRVLRRALAKQPENRYGSAAALRDDLKQVLRLPDDPTRVRPLHDDEQVTPGTRVSDPKPWSGGPRQTPTPGTGPTAGSSPSPVPAPVTFRTPTPPTFASSAGPGTPVGPGAPTGPSGPSGGNRNRMWVAVAVVTVVLVVGAVVLAKVIADSGGSNTAGEGDETTSSTGEPGTETTGGGEGTDADQQKAIENITQGILDDGSADDVEASTCIARNLVEQQGIAKLQELEVLDSELNFLNTDNPAAAGPVLSASFGCLGDLLSSFTPSS
ncbi:serine/threonine-protein kinase [Nocardioides sp. GXZ039]|uniref:serine/threonine-protein kinase n=1 Tax=Nocardioides sp. GXZ039 TaxID=3136018 RepID=UPI0030F489D2